MPESWLPAAPEPDRSGGRPPWRGETGLAYVVVDELDAGVCGLVVSEWPRVDGHGRLRFDTERDRHLAVDAQALRALLAERRVPVVDVEPGEDAQRALRERPLAVGDVFGARLAAPLEEDVDEPADPADWLEGPVLDVTAPAREAAKAQASATLAGVLEPADVEALAAEFTED